MFGFEHKPENSNQDQATTFCMSKFNKTPMRFKMLRCIHNHAMSRRNLVLIKDQN